MTETFRHRPVRVDGRRLKFAMWGGGGDDADTARGYREHGGDWSRGDNRDFDPRHDVSDTDRQLYNGGGWDWPMRADKDPEWHPGNN